MTQPIDRLLAVMARLRDPADGCAWDLAQNFTTIAPYTIEEAYEVADAIDRADFADLRGELGDLLLQVVFHARMAQEAGHFDFNDVAAAIADKMEARHPHIFGGVDGSMDEQRWETLKAAERAQTDLSGALDGVARSLPALMRAEKLQKRAARTGFDWPDIDGPAAKLAEELDELRAAPPKDREEEAGDLLFAAVNVVRAYGIAPETALRRANDKFERRFRAMEQQADGSLDGLSAAQQDRLWNAVKQAEQASEPAETREVGRRNPGDNAP